MKDISFESRRELELEHVHLKKLITQRIVALKKEKKDTSSLVVYRNIINAMVNSLLDHVQLQFDVVKAINELNKSSLAFVQRDEGSTLSIAQVKLYYSIDNICT